MIGGVERLACALVATIDHVHDRIDIVDRVDVDVELLPRRELDREEAFVAHRADEATIRDLPIVSERIQRERHRHAARLEQRYLAFYARVRGQLRALHLLVELGVEHVAAERKDQRQRRSLHRCNR